MSLSLSPRTLPDIVVAAGVGQLEVPDDTHPGLRPGDRLFTTPVHRFVGDDLYVMSFPNERYGLWRCAREIGRRNPGILCWREGRQEQTMVRLTSEEFGQAVVAQVAGWLHIRNRVALHDA